MVMRRLRARLGLASVGALMMDPQFVRRAVQDRGDDPVDSEASGDDPAGSVRGTAATRLRLRWLRWQLVLARHKP